MSNLSFKYFLIIVDDFTRFTWIYFLKNHSEVSNVFTTFLQYIDRQFNTTVKSFQSDLGEEFQKLQPVLQSQGINYHLACPHTHEQNEVAKCKIGHIMDTGLTLMAHSLLPFQYWPYAFDTVVHLINNLPIPLLQGQCLRFKLTNISPTYTDLSFFGCAAYPLLQP